MNIQAVHIKNILTRTTGFLTEVSSHSLQPYRGCSFGNHLCGNYCYVQFNNYVTLGRKWGSFLEPRTNAKDAYIQQYPAEQRWSRKQNTSFSIFMSSSTDPFIPQERQFYITKQILEAMIDYPPDLLIIQTRSPIVLDYMELYSKLIRRSKLRFHITIETDLDCLPNLPPHATSIDQRFEAAKRLKEAGFQVVVTVSPLLPICDPNSFFKRVAECAHAAVIDHFIEGDGTPDGRRTLKTLLPAAMSAIDSKSTNLSYRDRMAEISAYYLPTGVNIRGFSGIYDYGL